MNKKSVYTCETCSALYLCLKYFQEHRQKHATQEGRTIFPCTHCQTVHTSEHESHLHSISHKSEPPHHCEVCQKVLGISEEEVLGSRRSIGTATDFHVLNISLDKPMISVYGDNSLNSSCHNAEAEEDDGDDDDDDDDDDDEDEDDDDDDDDDEDEDDDEDDEEVDEEEDKMAVKQHKGELGGLINPGVTNIIYVTNQTINHNSASQKNYIKAARPSRSTGKGKGNRKARLTSDGDIRRKFSCCHCGKSFKTKSHLQRHILTHTGEKPYHCNRCDQRFNQSSTLRNHVIAIHTKEYPHTCNNCSKGFLMPAVLHKHLQTSECGRITNQVVEGL